MRPRSSSIVYSDTQPAYFASSHSIIDLPSNSSIAGKPPRYSDTRHQNCHPSKSNSFSLNYQSNNEASRVNRRLEESKKSLRVLQPHLQEPPILPRKKSTSPSNKENFYNVIAPSMDTENLIKNVTGCSRIYNAASSVGKQGNSLRRKVPFRALRGEAYQNYQHYIGNGSLLKDSSLQIRSRSKMMKNLRDQRSSIVGLPGSECPPPMSRPQVLNKSTRNLQTTYEQISTLPLYGASSTKSKARTAQNLIEREIFSIPSKRRYIQEKRVREVKSGKMRKPEAVRNAFSSSISFF